MTTNEQFKKAIQSEFSKRVKKNSSYSVRAFAQFLEIEPSSLAQILNGKRKLTDKMCVRLATRLNFSPLKVRSLLAGNSNRMESFSKFNKVNEDAFRVISEWHYYAILELTQCEGFQGRTQWIAKTLGLSFAETLESIDRLKRLNYLEITPEGKWIDRLGDTNNLGNEFKAPAFTEHQRQVLGKASEALSKVSYNQRVQSSMTVAGSKERVAEAKEMILNFIEELDAFIKSGPIKDEVFTISVSLFPISQIKPGDTNA
jgi:hypothetical protein